MEVAVYKELEKVKAELEQVKEECRKKTLLHQDLKMAYDDRIIEFREAKLRIEKLSEEICVKTAEVCEVEKICEAWKSSLAEKDFILRELRSAYDKLQASSEEKVKLLEGSSREFVIALDDAMEKNRALEDKLCARNRENEGLKARLLATESKCVEMEKKVRMSKELSGKDELIAKLEDEVRNVQDCLKWKSEQFDHLEEAHDKLHSEFRFSKLEWEKERLVLFDKISSLQSSLDSQTRISSSLQTKLSICNQALACEEGRRKLIEVQLTESKTLFENINAKCQEEQSKIDRLTVQRDEEIANLRGLLATKDIMFKEMEFKILELEQQKEGMHESLREFQEAGIKQTGSVTSVTKLQKKLQNLEVTHGNCSANLDIKEAEWTSQHERLKAEAEEHLSMITNKEVRMNKLHKELEMCQFTLQILNEEMAVVMMVLKSEYYEAYSKLHHEYENKKFEESCVSELDSKVTDLVEQNQNQLIEESQRKQRQLEKHILEMEQTKNTGLEMCYFSQQILNEVMAIVIMVLKSEYFETYSKLCCEYENLKYKESSVPVLDAKVANLVEQHQMLTNELEFCKNMVEESQRQQRQLEEQVLEIERTKRAELETCHFSLQILNEEIETIIMLLKLEYYEACSKLRCEYENKESSVPVLDAKITDLVVQQRILTNDLKFHKNIVEESQTKQRKLEENILEMERTNKAEMVEKTHESSLIKAELLNWKNIAGTLKSSLEEAQETNQMLLLKIEQASKQEIRNLKNAVKEHERNICALQQHVTSLEAAMKVKDDALKLLESKNKKCDGIIKELEFKNMHLSDKISSLVTHMDKVLVEMQGACNQLYEICCIDETLLGSFWNAEYALGDKISNTSRCSKTSDEG